MVSLRIVIEHLRPGLRAAVDYVIQDDGSGPYIAAWRSLEPQPTPAELAAAESRRKDA